MNNILISVLIANYNNEKFIVDAIQSVVNQSYSKWEIVVYDDGSNDKNWVRDIQSRFSNIDIRFYFSEQNKGCGFAKKELIDLARGEFFIFLDPDDTLAENCLVQLFQDIILDDKISISYATHFICDESLSILNVSKYPSKIFRGQSMFNLVSGNISAPALIRKAMYVESPGLNVNLLKAVDNDLYAKMEEVGYVSFVDVPLYFYRQHGANISTGKNELEALRYRLIVIQELYFRRKAKPSTYCNNISKKEKNEIEFLYYELRFFQKPIYSFGFWKALVFIFMKLELRYDSVVKIIKILKIKFL